MLNWKFIRPQSWYFHGTNAPAAAVYKDKLIVYGDPVGYGPVIETDNQNWEIGKPILPILHVPGQIQDPDLFIDDDGRVYLYEEPLIYGQFEL